MRPSSDLTSGKLTDELVEMAMELADEAGRIAKKYFKSGLQIEAKADESPVTIADREIERALRLRITRRFPDHGIVGEEEDASNPQARCVWVIDPIDGTKAFVCGIPVFGSLIALLVDGTPRLGVLEVPGLGERWVGVEGCETQYQGRPCHTRVCGDLKDAVMFATSPDMFSKSEYRAFTRLAQQVRFVRYGTDCYAYGLLASGFGDLVVESDMKPYDYLALVPVVERAGGVITDWHGQALGLECSSSSVLAAGSAYLHAQALGVLSG